MTDWTTLEPAEDHFLDDGEPIDFDLTCESAPCEERKETNAL